MAKVYNWHLVCETHEIDDWASCQTTGNHAESSERFISEYAQEIQAKKNCSRSLVNLIASVEEMELE